MVVRLLLDLGAPVPGGCQAAVDAAARIKLRAQDGKRSACSCKTLYAIGKNDEEGVAAHEVVGAAAVKRMPEEVQENGFPARTRGAERIITACMRACMPPHDSSSKDRRVMPHAAFAGTAHVQPSRQWGGHHHHACETLQGKWQGMLAPRALHGAKNGVHVGRESGVAAQRGQRIEHEHHRIQDARHLRVTSSSSAPHHAQHTPQAAVREHASHEAELKHAC